MYIIKRKRKNCSSNWKKMDFFFPTIKERKKKPRISRDVTTNGTRATKEKLKYSLESRDVYD